MGSTYGESWDLFHSEGTISNLNHDPPLCTSSSKFLEGQSLPNAGLAPAIPTSTTNSGLQSNLTNTPTSPEQPLLAQIQRLRQELGDLKRSISSSNTPPEQQGLDVAQTTSSNTVIASQPNNDDTSTTNTERTRNNATSNLPQCWDPCCNGRTFSNQSNLARHRREKRGEASKLRCSFCDAVFSRSSARNAHEAEKRCRNSGIEGDANNDS